MQATLPGVRFPDRTWGRLPSSECIWQKRFCDITKLPKNKKPSIAHRAWEKGNRQTINPLSHVRTGQERNNESVTHLVTQQWKDRRGVGDSLGTLDTMRNAQTRACRLVMERKLWQTKNYAVDHSAVATAGIRRNCKRLQ